MKPVRIGSLVLALLLCLAVSGSANKEPEGVRELMQKKLHYAQKVLEGIAQNDFKSISRSAEELMLISKTTSWKVYKTPRYQLYTNQFQRSIQDLQEGAEQKNIDKAALAYVDMTLTCVKCHKHVREVRMGRLEPVPLPLEGLGPGAIR
jgi:hypothetical protein